METYIQIMIEQVTGWLPRLGVAILILLFFWIMIMLLSHVIMGVALRLEIDEHLARLFVRVAKFGLWTLGLITIFGTLGVDITALVAGLGLTGFALGFALKDSISNMLAGVLILLYRPFTIGNLIRISGFEGKVISIDLRYTVITASNEKIYIPNSKLFTEPVTVLN